jgi:hypothetical protein
MPRCWLQLRPHWATNCTFRKQVSTTGCPVTTKHEKSHQPLLVFSMSSSFFQGRRLRFDERLSRFRLRLSAITAPLCFIGKLCSCLFSSSNARVAFQNHQRAVESLRFKLQKVGGRGCGCDSSSGRSRATLGSHQNERLWQSDILPIGDWPNLTKETPPAMLGRQQ